MSINSPSIRPSLQKLLLGSRFWKRDVSAHGRKSSNAPYRSTLPGYDGGAFFQRHGKWLLFGLVAFAFVYGFFFAILYRYYIVPLTLPLVAILGMCIWALPDTGKPPVHWLFRLLPIFIGTLLIWPDYLAFAFPGLPWLTAIRIVVTPMAIAMTIALSVSAEFRKQMMGILSATPALWKTYVAFTVLAFLSVGFSRQPGFSLNKFIVAQLYWTLIFFTSCYFFTFRNRPTQVVNLIWICVVVVCVVGVQEYRHSIVPWAGHIPSWLKIDDMAAQIMQPNMRFATKLYRVQSKFTTPLGCAEFLVFAAPFILHIGMTHQRSVIKALAFLTLPLLVFIVVRTDTRLGIVGLFSGLILYTLFWAVVRWKKHSGSLFAPLMVLLFPAGAASFLVGTFFIGRLHAMVWGSGAQKASTLARQAQLEAGIPKILSHPWGYGMGRAAEELGYFSGDTLTIDNYYLAIALDYGILGFLIYYSIFFIAAWYGGWTILRSKLKDEELLFLGPLLIALANFVIIKSVFSQIENHPLIFAFLGMVAALVYRARLESRGIEAPLTHADLANVQQREQDGAR